MLQIELMNNTRKGGSGASWYALLAIRMCRLIRWNMFIDYYPLRRCPEVVCNDVIIKYTSMSLYEKVFQIQSEIGLQSNRQSCGIFLPQCLCYHEVYEYRQY